MDFLNNPWVIVIFSAIIGPIIVYYATEAFKGKIVIPCRSRSILFVFILAFVFIAITVYITVAGLRIVDQ